MAGLYLTIDDSPSGNFDNLCAFLKERDIPALFYCRGDNLSLYPEKAVEAIKDGFIVANHSWSHQHASQFGADLAVKEILKTQKLIDECYKKAGVKQTIKSMRFPHMDSGLGNWPLPPERFNEKGRNEIEQDYARFYNNPLDKPDLTQITMHDQIKTRLKKEGFDQLQFDNVHVDWFKTYAQSDVVSTQGTFCHPDWFLYKRHRDKGHHTVESLNQNFDDFVARYPDSNQVLVMHDSIELWPFTQQLIDHMIKNGHKFLPIPQ